MKIDSVLWRILVGFPLLYTYVTCRDDRDGEFMNILGNQLSRIIGFRIFSYARPVTIF